MLSCETCKSSRSRVLRPCALSLSGEGEPGHREMSAARAQARHRKGERPRAANLYYERDFLCIVRHAAEADRALADSAE